LAGIGLFGYESPTNLQNFTRKDLTEVKIFRKVLGWLLFETRCMLCIWYRENDFQVSLKIISNVNVLSLVRSSGVNQS